MEYGPPHILIQDDVDQSNFDVDRLSFGDQDGHRKMSPFTASVIRNDIEELRDILGQYSDLNGTSCVFDEVKRVWRLETPLITACRLGHLAVVKELVQAGASLEFTDQGAGKTSLHWACARGHFNVAGFLINNGADVNRTDFQMETPLVEALASGCLPLIRLLLDSGVNLERPLNYDRDTPLIFSIYVNKLEIAQLLIEAGSNVHAKNRDREDPLSVLLASKINDNKVFPVTDLLLRAGHIVSERHYSLASGRQSSTKFKEALINSSSSRKTFTLKGYTCRRIRNILTQSKSQQSILSSIDMLPLPNLLKDSLKLRHAIP